ncbi:MAG: hypothetical protein M3R17_05560, partial [Bacteroidota bacterium]|nr:hypothetical protein [Bacteroidota bacterium]
MTERIILSIATIFMFVLCLKYNGSFHKIIMGGLTISILITWLTFPGVGLICYSGLMIFTFLIIIYGFSQKKLSTFERLIITLSAFIVFSKLLFSLMHYPYANMV